MMFFFRRDLLSTIETDIRKCRQQIPFQKLYKAINFYKEFLKKDKKKLKKVKK